MNILELVEKLNEEQKAPVLQTEGAVLVTAGAGSGKTRVLTTRIAYLIQEKNIHPYNILAITFTNKAAAEMKERVEKITYDCQDMWVCTFHSMCVRILRQNADKIGYTKNFTIYAEQEKENVVKEILTELKLDDELKKSMMFHIGNAKNQNLNPTQYKNEFAYLRDIDDICKVYSLYQENLKNNNAFDFDDLLIKTFELLDSNSSVREKYQERFQYIHIDEFQDTNKVQYEIAKILAGKYGNIMVVGDEDQCIYGWRGANIENIFNFKKEFPNVNVFKLEQNYRCTKRIIEVANKVIQNNSQRLDKVLYTNNDEGDPIELFVGNSDIEEAGFVARRIDELKRNGIDYKDVAVLMRYNAMSRTIEEGLLQYNIPYKVIGGMKFYDRAEIKNVLAYLKVMVNNRDNESLLRIINFPKRGVGSSTINQLRVLANQKNESIMNYLKNYIDEIPTSIRKKIQPFRDLMVELIEKQNTMPLLEIVKEVISKAKIKQVYEEKDTKEDESRILNIDSLLASVDSYEKIYPSDSLSEYLQSVTLLSDTDEQDDTQNAVTLATVHAVKGLEFKGVFVIGLEDENFPILKDGREDDIEEERRLFYVAVTRAKLRLHLSRCKRRFKYGDIRNFMPSRFLDELKDIEFKGFAFNRGYGMDSQTTDFSASSSPTFAYKSTYSIPKSMTSQCDYSKSNDGFVVGARVEHPRFGLGYVIDVSRLDSANVIGIDFDDVGLKNLIFDVSPLTLI